jgi:hypothetical protein
VDTVCAVHQPDLRDRVVAETTIAPWRQLAPPVDLIHDYVGSCLLLRTTHRCDSDMSRSHLLRSLATKSATTLPGWDF